MIVTDKDFSFENKYGMIIPFSFILRGSEEPEIHCCSDVYDFISDLCKRHTDLLSNDFFTEADGYLRKYAVSHGFSVYDEDIDDFYFSYVMDDTGENLERKEISSQKIISSDFENLTEYDILSYIEDGLGVYGTLIDGKLVSAAAENLFDIDYDDGIEISVETAEGYRRRGYGSANVRALASDIISRGKKAYYVTSHKNSGSVRLAESLGFRLDSVFYSYCCYK